MIENPTLEFADADDMSSLEEEVVHLGMHYVDDLHILGLNTPDIIGSLMAAICLSAHRSGDPILFYEMMFQALAGAMQNELADQGQETQ